MDRFIGSHHVREEGDVLAVTLVGDESVEEAKEFIAVLERLIERHGCYGMLIGVSKLGTISPEARRLTGQWPGSAACYGNAVYGGSVTTRTLLTFVLRAIRLFRKQSLPIAFFKTEDEARAWLAEQRERARKPSQ
jgi:hypothetical protein